MGKSTRAVDTAQRSARILGGLRAFGAVYTEFTTRFATYLGLHSTDAAALVEILYAEDMDAPLSPSRLGDRLGLSSGATTNLLNRLERLGHIVRTREHTDRRIVTVRSSTEIEGPAREFFAPFSAQLEALVAGFPAAKVDEFEEFLLRLKESMTELLED